MNFPLILGFVLALFGVATLLHLLVVSVARRRHEIGLLKALGFVKAQVGATVCWQASTVALVGIVVGTPLGIAAGQAVWRAFATNLGAVPDSIVPVEVIAALGLGARGRRQSAGRGPGCGRRLDRKPRDNSSGCCSRRRGWMGVSPSSRCVGRALSPR